MIEMSWVYFWGALALTAFVSAFVAYWIGRDIGEKSKLMERWDRQTEHMERLQRIMAENHRLRREIEKYERDALYSESVWNNVRNVPDQPGQ